MPLAAEQAAEQMRSPGAIEQRSRRDCAGLGGRQAAVYTSRRSTYSVIDRRESILGEWFCGT